MNAKQSAGLALVVALVGGACGAGVRAEGREVVFVCEHGAAKSVLAMTYFNKLAAERGLDLRAIARGADPQDQPSATTLAGLTHDGLPASAAAPRPVTAAELRGSARVIAFDCGLPAMKALRAMDACWDDVPTVGSDYAGARAVVRAHVAALLDELATPRGGGAAR